jgi:FtsP/CotA-like multicopper oxidase with cupredoxin domain
MGMLPGLCINGKTHDLSRIDVETELGTLEVWKIVSRGMAHPFHVHGASFRILSIGGTPPPAHLAVGKTWFSSKMRPSFWWLSIDPRRGSTPLCITVTSSNTKMHA